MELLLVCCVLDLYGCLVNVLLVVANEGQRIDIPDGCILENRLLSGNLNMIVCNFLFFPFLSMPMLLYRNFKSGRLITMGLEQDISLMRFYVSFSLFLSMAVDLVYIYVALSDNT